MEIAFLMDRLESIEPVYETSSYLMYECNERGHTVYFLEPHDVYIRGNEIVARMRNISVRPGLPMEQYWHSVFSRAEMSWVWASETSDRAMQRALRRVREEQGMKVQP